VKLSEAHRRISDLFGREVDPGSIAEDDFVELLEPLERRGIGVLAGSPLAVRKFLYHGCLKFDRWAPPTPIVLDPETSGVFDRFLAALDAADVSGGNNIALFRLHQIKTKIYDAFAMKTMPWGVLPNDPTKLDKFEESCMALSEPTDAGKRQEFTLEKARVLSLIASLRTGSASLRIETSLPHPVVLHTVEGKGVWQGLSFRYAVDPMTTETEGFAAEDAATVRSLGPSRWPSGTSNVSLTVSALVDHAQPSPLLTMPGARGAGPLEWQPLVQSLAYELIHALILGIQERAPEVVDPLWTVLPRDISRLALSSLADDVEIFSAPLLALGGWRMTILDESTSSIDFESLTTPPYWSICRRNAQAYLGLGATREALLWLNMGAEALIDERIDSLRDSAPESFVLLTSSKLVFQEAEEVLAAQFPDMAGTVIWPETATKPSRWSQIKGLHRVFDRPGSPKEAQNHYKRIVNRRNGVVHGSDSMPVDAGEVSDGLGSLDWLASNLLQHH
jgi:hypothetical protein